MLVLDTQTLLWWWFDVRRLGARATSMIEDHLDRGQIAVSSFSFWEISMLQLKERIDFVADIRAWRDGLVDRGVRILDVTAEIAIRANELADFHADPADRIIVATALDDHQLMTSDARFLAGMVSWSG